MIRYSPSRNSIPVKSGTGTVAGASWDSTLLNLSSCDNLGSKKSYSRAPLVAVPEYLCCTREHFYTLRGKQGRVHRHGSVRMGEV
jgi:hypothetical protein